MTSSAPDKQNGSTVASESLTEALHRRGILTIAQDCGLNSWREFPCLLADGSRAMRFRQFIYREGKWRRLWDTANAGKPIPTAYITPLTTWKPTMVLCEGEPDLWSLHAAGITSAIAAWGTSGVRGLRKLFQSKGTARIIMLVDNDEAGRNAAGSVRDELAGTGIDFEAKSLRDHTDDKGDVNDLWIACKFDSDTFRNALKTLPDENLPPPQKPKQEYTTPLINDSDADPDFLRRLETALLQRVEYHKRRGKWIDIRHPFKESNSSPRETNSSYDTESGRLKCHSTDELIYSFDLADKLGVEKPKAKRPNKSKTLRDKARDAFLQNASAKRMDELSQEAKNQGMTEDQIKGVMRDARADADKERDKALPDGTFEEQLAIALPRIEFKIEFNTRAQQAELTAKSDKVVYKREPLLNETADWLRNELMSRFKVLKISSSGKPAGLKPLRITDQQWRVGVGAYPIKHDKLYDPAVEWLMTLRDHPAYQLSALDCSVNLSNILRLYDADDNLLTAFASKALYIGPVIRALRPGSYQPGEDLQFLVILQSVKKGVGKSSLIQSLVPSHLRQQLFQPSLPMGSARTGGLQGAVDERSRRRLGKWICALEEIKIFPWLKDEVSSNQVTVRPLYKNPYTITRNDFWVGSTNELSPLPNEADNRRYIVIALKKNPDNQALLHDDTIAERYAWALKCFDEGMRLNITDGILSAIRKQGRAYTRTSQTDDWVDEQHEAGKLDMKTMKEIKSLLVDDMAWKDVRKALERKGYQKPTKVEHDVKTGRKGRFWKYKG